MKRKYIHVKFTKKQKEYIKNILKNLAKEHIFYPPSRNNPSFDFGFIKKAIITIIEEDYVILVKE